MCCSPAGSHDHGISQARTLEWVSISLSRGSSRTRDQTHVACTDRRILYHKATGKPFERDFSLYACVLSHFGHVRLFTTLRTVAHQAPLSMGFSRQEYWSGLPCPPPGDLPDPGIKPESLMSPALEVGFFTTSATWEALPLSKCI